MDVSSATSTTGTSTTSSSTSAGTQNLVDYNSFLQLLVAQMKNQDPTNPTDPSQYLTQISQMAGVQQGILTNTKLDSMLTQSSLTQAENAIGKIATSSDGKTTGTVTSVALATDGTVTATLSTGKTLTLNNTVTIGTSSTSS